MSTLGKPSKELVLDEVNKKSTEVLSFAKISFAPPAINPGNLHDRNTSLLLTDISGEYNGSTRTVFYNRLDLQVLFTNSGISEIVLAKPTDFTSVIQLLDEINLVYGLALSDEDIEDEAPAVGDAQVLRVKSTSYAYLNQLAVTIDSTLPPVELEDVIPNNILDGLNYPETVAGLIRPIIVYGNLTGPGVNEEGQQLLGVDHPVRDYSVMTNDELTTAWSPRHRVNGIYYTVAPVDGKFTVSAPVSQDGVAVIDMSLSLIPKIGSTFDDYNLTELYDIYVIANCSSNSNNSFTFKLAAKADKSGYEFIDDVTGSTSISKSVEYAVTPDKLTCLMSIDVGPTSSYNGDYEFAIVATRRRSIAHRLANVAQVSFVNA